MEQTIKGAVISLVGPLVGRRDHRNVEAVIGHPAAGNIGYTRGTLNMGKTIGELLFAYVRLPIYCYWTERIKSKGVDALKIYAAAVNEGEGVFLVLNLLFYARKKRGDGCYVIAPFLICSKFIRLTTAFLKLA
jgi:hypothetical protein